jgi:hypothetical protein
MHAVEGEWVALKQCHRVLCSNVFRAAERRLIAVGIVAFGGCALPSVSQLPPQAESSVTESPRSQAKVDSDASAPSTEEQVAASETGGRGAASENFGGHSGDGAAHPNLSTRSAAGSGGSGTRESQSASSPTASAAPTIAPAHAFAEWPMPSAVPDSPNVPSYSVSVATVTDNVTKLVWQREQPAVYAGCSARRNNSMVSGESCTWEEAKQYCLGPALAAALGGTGWRLPTKIELESLMDETSDDVTLVDRAVFPSGLGKVWTSTSYAGRAGEAWFVGFSEDGSGYMETANGLGVTCVR